MQQLLKTFTLIFLFTAAQAYLFADESFYLENGSFEREETKDQGRPAHSWNSWGTSLQRVVDWAPVLEGKAMLAYKHWEVTSSESSGIWQDLGGLSAGMKVSVTVPVYPDTPETGDLMDAVELRLETTLNDHQVVVESKRFTADDFKRDTWNELSISTLSPNASMRLVIFFYPSEGSRGGALKVDGIHVSTQP